MRTITLGICGILLSFGCEEYRDDRVQSMKQEMAIDVVQAALDGPGKPSWTLADDVILAPLWKGDNHKGRLYTPMWRGSNGALEDFVYAPEDGECGDIKGTTRIDWDEDANSVNFTIKYEGMPVSPEIDRTEGVDFWSNPFHDRPIDFTDSGYRLWIIYSRQDRPPTTFYYDASTFLLLGSEYDFPAGPPVPAIPVELPLFGLFSSDLMFPDENGDVSHQFSIAYDHVGQEGGAVGHALLGFVPLDLCQGNPFDPTAGQLRQYHTPWLTVEDSPSWEEALQSGLILDTTIEDASILYPDNDPPYIHGGVAFIGNTPSLQGGIPSGMHFDLRASIREVQPVLTPIPGGNGSSCQSFVSFPLVSGPNLCQSPATVASAPADIPMSLASLSRAALATGSPADAMGDMTGVLSPTSPLSMDHYEQLRRWFDEGVLFSREVEFPNRIGALGDPVAGQGNFGIAADGMSADDTTALFEGLSLIAGQVESNGRTCRTCHLPGHDFGLPPLPLSDSVPPTDALFTGLDADSGGDPLAATTLDELGLLPYRPGRFNPHLPANSPIRQVFFWRKSTRLVNTVFTFGNLNDGRARTLVEAARGAAFTHTQSGDLRFDDLVDRERLDNIGAFIEQNISDPALAALFDPGDPMYRTLNDDPFYTVDAVTDAQVRGQELFDKHCMPCHNMPNVFSNVEHANGFPIKFPPRYGHTMDIGVAQRNKHGLDFRRYDAATNTRVPVTVTLVAQDGEMISWTVTDDIGSAASSGRFEDLHRFKVPQLRNISRLGPYFHDNSAATLEEVVDYFTSDWYNESQDGKKYPIHLNAEQKADLVEFLQIL